jgi:3-hydroxyisobutyrate dehydrogenase
MADTAKGQEPALRLGVIGIGAMGMPVALRALDCGITISVRDIRPEAERDAAAAGASVQPSPAAVGRHSEVVVVLVVDRHQVETVLFATDGVVAGMAPGGIVVVSSTIESDYAEALGPRLSGFGLHHIDGPVSGGPARARDGSMSMMAAGADGPFERALPLLRTLAAKLFHVGSRSGDGARTKMLNNLLAGVNLAAAAEAIALGERLGVDPRALLAVIRASSGDSWMLGDRMPRALDGDFAPRAAVDILKKDLGIVTEAARASDYPTPLADAARAVFTAASDAGLGGEDDAALLKLYRLATIRR